MENCFHARVGSLPFVRQALKLSLAALMFAFISGCASSNVSRDAASNVDMGVKNAKKLGGGLVQGDIAESYQNTNMGVRGGILGGAAGALGGLASSTIGIVPGTIAGAILGATYGSYIDSQATLSDKLINRGATVVELGDQILIVINSKRLFKGMTSDLKPQAYSTLNLLTEFINQYTNMMVRISAYTDNIGSKQTNLAVSKKQARALERYLADNGLNTRVLYAQGYGATNLVEKNNLEWGMSDNYRVELTLQKLEA